MCRVWGGRDGWLVQESRVLKAESPLSAETCENLVRQAYLRTLSRQPDDHELARCVGHVQGSADAAAGLGDLLWALINTKEFILNH